MLQIPDAVRSKYPQFDDGFWNHLKMLIEHETDDELMAVSQKALDTLFEFLDACIELNPDIAEPGITMNHEEGFAFGYFGFKIAGDIFGDGQIEIINPNYDIKQFSNVKEAAKYVEDCISSGKKK
jgi:hypothetical protein